MEELSGFSRHIIQPAIMIVDLFIGVCVSLIRFRGLDRPHSPLSWGLLLILSVLFEVVHSVWVV
jgi:hypothetical protein